MITVYFTRDFMYIMKKLSCNDKILVRDLFEKGNEKGNDTTEIKPIKPMFKSLKFIN